MKRDLEYEKNNIGYDEQYTKKDGGGIKCKNYIVCNSLLPDWWFDCKNSYLCTNCHMMFGTWGDYVGKGVLEITKKLECPICLEIKKCISLPRCEHSVCIECFKRCYYGSEENEPAFPYPEIEDEYDNDSENPKWNNNYPLIEIYNEEYEIWLDEKEEKYSNEEYLRKCPLCRK